MQQFSMLKDAMKRQANEYEGLSDFNGRKQKQLYAEYKKLKRQKADIEKTQETFHECLRSAGKKEMFHLISLKLSKAETEMIVNNYDTVKTAIDKLKRELLEMRSNLVLESEYYKVFIVSGKYDAIDMVTADLEGLEITAKNSLYYEV